MQDVGQEVGVTSGWDLLEKIDIREMERSIDRGDYLEVVSVGKGSSSGGNDSISIRRSSRK